MQSSTSRIVRTLHGARDDQNNRYRRSVATGGQWSWLSSCRRRKKSFDRRKQYSGRNRRECLSISRLRHERKRSFRAGLDTGGTVPSVFQRYEDETDNRLRAHSLWRLDVRHDRPSENHLHSRWMGERQLLDKSAASERRKYSHYSDWSCAAATSVWNAAHCHFSFEPELSRRAVAVVTMSTPFNAPTSSQPARGVSAG